MVKNLPENAGDAGDTSSTSMSGRSPGGGNDNPSQNSDRGASWATYSPWGHKESDMTKQLSIHTHISWKNIFHFTR